jgi:hypothetical protein
MPAPTRRTFLQTVAAAIASFFLPRGLRAERRASFWILHTETGEWWSVTDPVGWTLANSKQPILARASAGLRTLTPADDQRITRLVVRRCKLNLIEVRAERVAVQYWGQQGLGDLRPFFKQHHLARSAVNVSLIDRKRETTTVQTGADFLYGERLSEEFPLGAFQKKWRRRATDEPDDWTPAPCSWSSYCWEGVEQRCIPWRVLKCLWRNEDAPTCPNCDKPTLVITFGMFVAGFYKLEPKVVRICPLCRSRFEEGSSWGGSAWMLANLDKPLLPSCEMRFGHPVKFTLPWTPEGQAHELNLRLVNCLNQIDGRCNFGVETSTERIFHIGKRRTVTVPPFDESVDDLEAWCRNVIRLLPLEE